MTYYIYVERGEKNSKFISKEFGDFIEPVVSGLGIANFAETIVNKFVTHAEFIGKELEPSPLDEDFVLGRILIPVEI